MTLPKTLELRGWDPKLEGVGEQLTFVLEAAKRGSDPGRDQWRGRVRVKVDRWFVLQLCRAVAEMQAADRRRINEELARLSTEIAPLKKSTTTEGD